MRFPLFLLLALSLLLMGGCTRADLDQAAGYAAAADTALAQADERIAQLESGLAVARQLAQQTGSEQAAATVATLEMLTARAKEALPAIKEAATAAHASLDQLRAEGGSTVAWWKVALGVLVPVLLPLASGIPVIGPAVGMVGKAAWLVYSTRQQKEAQARMEAEASALPLQVDATHAALALLPPDQAKQVKDDARAAQELAGLHDVIRPHVLKVEAYAKARDAA